ncbi:MAG TPA: hypothetical protein VFR28_02525 [Allosphingosinicella sp.]|jgi:hypothetical protein|nr:hypothetical protein [Allosphingosinicella sp.]
MLGLAGVLALAAPVFAFALPDLQVLSKLERGRWQLRSSEGPERSICIGDPAVLVQLEHQGVSCGHEILANEAAATTVQYTCSGRGFGHTRIRLETPRLARIETQGLADGRPFSYRVEARKVGSC